MNNFILAPLCAWAIAQLAKVLLVLVRRKQVKLRHFITSGGMPSSHSAIVSALATSIAIVEGTDSITFGISVILAAIVMYDAAGVRRSVGMQSVILERIVKELRERKPIAALEKDLREFIGHTPVQVFAGSLLGIVIAWLWFTITAD